MPKIITWDDIDSVKKFNFFALGLQPLDKDTLEPIECPEYCHSYHVLGKIHPNYHPIMEETLADWVNRIKTNSFDSLSIDKLPERYKDLMDTDLYYRCCDKEKINLTLKDLKQMQASLTQEKTKFDECKKKRTEIIDEASDHDPDCAEVLKSWKYFQKPKSKNHLNELMKTLRDNVVFNKDDVDRITRSQNSDKRRVLPDQDTEKDQLFKKYLSFAINYSIRVKKKKKQPPTEIELANHLEAELRKNQENLGPRSQLPNEIFRQIRKEIPKDLKRKIGEKSIK